MFVRKAANAMFASSSSTGITRPPLSALYNDHEIPTVDLRRLSTSGMQPSTTLTTRPAKSVLPDRPQHLTVPQQPTSVVNSFLSCGMSTNKLISVGENGNCVRVDLASEREAQGNHNGFSPLYRTQFSEAKRIVIKLGSAVITRQDGGNGLALGRLASIVEQVAELQNNGRECVLITSGAVEFGKQILSNELQMSMSLRESMQANSSNRSQINSVMKDKSFTKPNAAVGQSGLQALYETMFRNYGIVVGQVLVNKQDFVHEYTRHHLLSTMNELLALGIIPIINTNDAVISAPGVVENHGHNTSESLPISDNDSLAANIAVSIGAHLAILMSNVDGIYDKAPTKTAGGGRVIHTFNPEDIQGVEFGEASSVGTGGMESKAKAALWALQRGSPSIICNGMAHNTIRKIMAGQKIGTFFTTADKDVTPVEVLAKNARKVSRRLQSLSPSERANIIHGIADALLAKAPEIIEQNKLDLALAKGQGLTGPMYDRLIITEPKIKSLSEGLYQIADRSLNNLGRVVRRTQVSESISLVQKTVPIGVLMVIFESRPDCLPQVASLAIASANGLLMKGGKEAANTNEYLMDIVKRELARYSCEEAISLVSSREAIGDLLKMDQAIDLVIPRGSSELVRSIKEQSKMIPVLGHAEGVCHVYVDVDADQAKALNIVKDSKCDYPAACNAMETLLIHESLLQKPTGGQSFFEKVCAMLKANDVEIFSGPNLQEHLTFGPSPAENLRFEYGDKACTVEIVKDVYSAMEHIHTFGSSHTDVIVSENPNTVESFLEGTDSACTFANISSRIADGYRMGLGAEVGISTGRIHARGPVGVEGLLTTKWVVRGSGDTASDYANGNRTFLHKQLAIDGPAGVEEEEDKEAKE